MKCYYDVLEVPQTASAKEIKKSYFRLALLHHPDKNLQNQVDQNENFALIQEAYEVLNDVNERAWYDSNRQHILRGPLDLSQRGTTQEYMAKEDLIPFFSKSCLKPNKDFYKVYGDLFVKIDNEERLSAQNDPESLAAEEGNSDWSFGKEGDEFPNPRLSAFYNKFSTFSSCKSFKWFDEFRVMDYSDRPSKRLAEKKNKRHREFARKEFNTMVRDLVSYVKNRDPRVKKYLQKQALEADKRKLVLEEQKEKAKLQKAQQISEYVEPEWAVTDDQYLEELEDDELECVVCDMVFKNTRHCRAHMKTKEHLEMVEVLRQEMELEELNLNDDNNETDTEPTEELPLVIECLTCESVFKTQAQLDAHNQSKKHRQRMKKANTTSSKPKSEPTEKLADNSQVKSSEPLHESQGAATTSPIAGKKKRRAVKTDTEASKFKCNVCKEQFPSKTKLFSHIKALDHARAIS